jgi:hypothetical protein
LSPRCGRQDRKAATDSASAAALDCRIAQPGVERSHWRHTGREYLCGAAAVGLFETLQMFLSQTAARRLLMAEHVYDLPDARGHFGPYGGVFVAETLIAALDELKEAYAAAQRDPQFVAEFDHELAIMSAGRVPSTTPGAGRNCSAVRRFT